MIDTINVDSSFNQQETTKELKEAPVSGKLHYLEAVSYTQLTLPTTERV
jgi:hypothetical protein